MKDRPNIILLMTDQQKFSASRMGGHPLLVTPGADRLAAEGVSFTGCFVQSPLCQPSRASMLTGTYPQVNGVMSNSPRGGGISPNLTQVQEVLKADGYTCGAVGHFHKSRGFDRGWDWSLDMSESPIREASGEIWAYSEEMAPRSEYGWVGWWCGASPLPAEASPGELITDAAIGFLDEVGSAPFFLHIPYEDPHPPYMAPAPFDTMYSPDGVVLPPAPNWDRATRRLAQLSKEAGMDLCDAAQVRRVMAMYYGMISYVDGQFVRLLDHLERRGVLDNTWIFYVADHGDFTGEHGMMTKAEMFYDCLVHVPLVVRPPKGMMRAGTRCDDLVELVDLFPSICDAAGVDTGKDACGRSFLPWARGEGKELFREAVFGAVGGNTRVSVHNLPQGIAVSSRLSGVATMVRTRKGKLIQNPDENELYLLGEDPWELENRYGQADVAEVQADLEARLGRWLDVYPLPAV